MSLMSVALAGGLFTTSATWETSNTGVHVSFSIMVSIGYMPSSGIVGSYGSFIPSFLRNIPTVLHNGYQFAFPQTVQESSIFSICSPAFIACTNFDDGHSDW